MGIAVVGIVIALHWHRLYLIPDGQENKDTNECQHNEYETEYNYSHYSLPAPLDAPRSALNRLSR